MALIPAILVVFSMMLVVIGIMLAFAPPRRLLQYFTNRDGVIFNYKPSLLKTSTNISSSSGSDGTSIVDETKQSSSSPEKVCVLSIDDFPSASSGIILKALGDSKAVFFTIGESAKNHSHWLRKAYDDGHIIGNHDIIDRRTAAHRTKDEIKQGLIECDRELMKHINSYKDRGVFVRPGGGYYNTAFLEAANELGQTVLLGDTYGHDCRVGKYIGIPVPPNIEPSSPQDKFGVSSRPSSPSLLDDFYLWRVQPGSVVILHDGDYERAVNTAHVIRHLKNNGWKFVLPPIPKSNS